MLTPSSSPTIAPPFVPTTAPIVGLDHLQVNVADLEIEIVNYSALFDTAPCWHGEWEGKPTALFDAGNLMLCLSQSVQPAGLGSLCFRVDDRERMRRRLQRVGLALKPQSIADPIENLAAAPLASTEMHAPGDGQQESLDVLEAASARGLNLSFVSRKPVVHSAERSTTVDGLDHVVIASGNAEATAFMLAAQLGLDMRLDMQRPEWNSRMMFFRCGDLIVEVVQRLDHSVGAAEDSFYGLSWRVDDAQAMHARLSALDFELSAVRDGRKPGTRVFSVKSRTAGVATLLLQPA